MQPVGEPAVQRPVVLVLAGLPGSGKCLSDHAEHTGMLRRLSLLRPAAAHRRRRCHPAAAAADTANTSQLTLARPLCPHAGKSTLAAWFAQAGWQVINQDSLGDRKQCEAACCAALHAGRSCVIDRTNVDMRQRSHWLAIGRRYGAACYALCLELPVEVCLQRALARSGHATLAAADAPAVIDRFAAEWQQPTTREGFDAVYVASTSQEGEVLAQQLLAWLPASGVPQQAALPPNGGPPGLYSWAPAPHQQQQRRQYTSRADAASSWRRSDDGGTPPPSPPRDQHRQQQWHAWPAQQQQQQQWQTPHAAGFASAARRGSAADGASNVVPFPSRHGRQQPTHHPQQGGQTDPTKPRRHPWSRHDADEPSGLLLDAQPSAKPILMFDANGVLTSHTSMRRSSGLHIARPGTHHLRRLKVGKGARACPASQAGSDDTYCGLRELVALVSCACLPAASPWPWTSAVPSNFPPCPQEHYRIGIYSSASHKTVDTALALLEEAAGRGARHSRQLAAF